MWITSSLHILMLVGFDVLLLCSIRSLNPIFAMRVFLGFWAFFFFFLLACLLAAIFFVHRLRDCHIPCVSVNMCYHTWKVAFIFNFFEWRVTCVFMC